MLLAALTGGIGSGKSTLAAGLARRGAPVVDADQVARQVVEPGGPAYQPLLERFGSGIRSDDGTIDRPALAAIVFNDPEALADLNRITHPVIGQEVLRRLADLKGHAGPVVLDVPLLNRVTVELYKPGALVVVDTPEEVAVERLVAHRGFSEGDARARIAAQATREERRALIGLVEHGLVVDNSGDLEAMEQTCTDVWRWLSDLPA
ncbi:dephospho-CoA kinase [Acidiferrimicrobium sp. IK]|uniref:dephospho-CoA kinase n=1 Tax=Acidiferrimicrobium sp. IK TaxID=2871700 RepID=UPI0021CB279B|nr:dephospho-CoA kinase [Acidiferrimicrobium sp. IK]MCU4183550.1 dephospho-CoA kinase [Acidiferrimicrobium sp. IK]